MRLHTGAVTAVGALLLVNGLVIGAPMTVEGFTAGREVAFTETVADWRYVAFNTVYLLLLVALVVTAPALTGWRGRTGRLLPRWTVLVLMAVGVLQACTVFSQAVVTPFLLEVAPQALTAPDGGAFAMTMTAIWIAWIIALWIVAIAGLVTRSMPVGAAVLMIVGGLIIPVFGPIGSILVGAALAWAGMAQLRIEPAAVGAQLAH